MDLNIFKFRYIINIVLRDQRVAFFLLQEWQHYSIMHKHDLTCALIPKYFSSKCEGDSLKGTEDVKVQNYSLQLCIFATTEHADVQTKDSLQEITTSDKYSVGCSFKFIWAHASFASVDVLPVQNHKYRCC